MLNSIICIYIYKNRLILLAIFKHNNNHPQHGKYIIAYTLYYISMYGRRDILGYISSHPNTIYLDIYTHTRYIYIYIQVLISEPKMGCRMKHDTSTYSIIITPQVTIRFANDHRSKIISY